MAAGNDVVVIARAGLTVSVKLALAVNLGVVESVTVTVTGKDPAAVGVPLIWPPVLIERPLGNPEAVNV